MKNTSSRSKQPKGGMAANLHQDENSDSIGLIYYWLPLLAYAGTIALISSLSTPRVHIATLTNVLLSLPTDQLAKINDKVVHLAEYMVLGVLTSRAMNYSWGSKFGTYTVFLAVAIVGAFGFMDELHQWFVPTRDMEGLDLLADICGGIIGVALWEWALTIPVIQIIEEQLPRKIPSLKNFATPK